MCNVQDFKVSAHTNNFVIFRITLTFLLFHLSINVSINQSNVYACMHVFMHVCIYVCMHLFGYHLRHN